MVELNSKKNYDQRLEQMMSQTGNEDGENFKLGIILLSVFIIVLIVIFGVYIFRYKKVVNQNTDQNNQAVTEEPIKTNERNSVINTLVNKIADSDKDGLTDQEEINTYKTNPDKADTDSDGLSDREEAVVYKTNPSKADTDDDGKSDGEEIKLRRNPLDSNPNAEWPPRPTNFK